MNKTTHNPETEARRKGVRRTAWVVAAIAVAIYAAFIASGVFAQ
ncbi:hypothetical protein [Lysobacter silvisoli]|nr:hypothetical protein [Lysobacter silvisoli]